VTGATRPGEYEFDVRWFLWREVQAAFAHGRAGGIALHRFRHDLRRFGLGQSEPACHMLSADRAGLVTFAARFGLRPAWIEPPRPHRPDIWHFDVFGSTLRDLEGAYPPPTPAGRMGVSEMETRESAERLLRGAG
jgi:hypothetical protein